MGNRQQNATLNQGGLNNVVDVGTTESCTALAARSCGYLSMQEAPRQCERMLEFFKKIQNKRVNYTPILPFARVE